MINVTGYRSLVSTSFYSVVLMLIANLHDVRVRVPLFHSKTKTHFEDTWSVDELPPEAQFFREAACGRHEQRRFCLEERVVERQKRL